MVEEKFLQVGADRIRYLKSGSGKRTLVLVHGLGASAERWNSIIPRLADDFCVVAPDLIGFGYSDKPHANYTMDLFLDFMQKFLEMADVCKPTMIGASMGGQIAAEFASTHPRCVDKLVLVSPSGTMNKPTPALDAYILASLYPNKHNATAAFEMMQPSGEINDEFIDSFVTRMKLPNAKLAFMSTVLGLSNTQLGEDKMGAISAPTLLVWGSNDAVIPIEHAYKFASMIQDCEFFRMEGYGHAPFAESPSVFVDRVHKFMGTE